MIKSTLDIVEMRALQIFGLFNEEGHSWSGLERTVLRAAQKNSMSSLRLRVVSCKEHQPFCPQTANPPGSIPVCAIVEASAIQSGTLTIEWDRAVATIVKGTETVHLSGGTYDKHFEWVFMPLVAGRTIHLTLTAKAGSLIQTAEYPVEV